MCAEQFNPSKFNIASTGQFPPVKFGGVDIAGEYLKCQCSYIIDIHKPNNIYRDSVDVKAITLFKRFTPKDLNIKMRMGFRN